MEKVDLSKAQAGWTAHFRCGGSAVIESAKNSKVLFYDCEKPLQFYTNGRYLVPDVSTPFDIIRLEPPAFDWKDVKPGMAFKFNGRQGHEGELVFYCFKQADGQLLFSIEGEAHPQALRSFGDCLVPAPKHDIQVQS